MSYEFATLEWRAQALKVVDGDTADLFVDCGFHQFGLYRFRFFGIDTPELRSRDKYERIDAIRAKETVIELLDAPPLEDRWKVNLKTWPIRIKTYKDPDSFGRWLAELFVKTAEGDELSVCGELLRLNLANPYEP